MAPFFGVEAPSKRRALAGDVGISFSCDPDAAHRLLEMALVEVERLQARAPGAARHAVPAAADCAARDLGCRRYQSILLDGCAASSDWQAALWRPL